MWRDRITQRNDPDAKTAKDLRSAFISEYCRAVYYPIEASKQEIEGLEACSYFNRIPRTCTLEPIDDADVFRTCRASR